MILGGSLECRTDNSYCGAYEDGSYASDVISDPSAGEGAYQSSQIIDRHYAALEDVIGHDHAAVWALMPKSHAGIVVVRGIDASHDTLIIAKEQNG